MSEIFNRGPLPAVKRITLGGANILTEIHVPVDTGKVSIQFITDPGMVTFEGVDGDAIGTDYGTVINDVWFQINWAPMNLRNTGLTSVFVSTPTGGTVVEVIVEG